MNEGIVAVERSVCFYKHKLYKEEEATAFLLKAGHGRPVTRTVVVL